MDHMDIHQKDAGKTVRAYCVPPLSPRGAQAQAQGSGPELLPQQSPALTAD